MNINRMFIGRVFYDILPKISFAMKIIPCLLFLTMAVSTDSHAQQITIQAKRASMETVLKQLRKQSGYDLLYSERLLKQAKPVTVNLSNSFLDEVLNAIFQDQPLTYEIDGHTIIVKEVKSSLANKIKSIFTATIDVQGHIVDPNGKPVASVTVRTADNKVATTTNADGDFLLKNVSDGVNVIISAVGFKTLEVKTQSQMGIIVLLPAVSKLDEVMVIGYGTTTQRTTTGSQSKVSGASVAQQPQSNPILGLEGLVPGLFINSNSGATGTNISVTIRGQNSLNPLTAQPLFVIDGVPFDSRPVEQSVGGFMGAIGFSPLNTINPDDIESISVLKDADATAIYGSRGAAGVILITTKKGRPGATQFTIDVSSGAGKATNMVKMLNTEQYISLRKQAFANDGVTPTAINAPDLFEWSPTTNNNFGKQIMGETAHQTNASFSVSGGSMQTQFVFGGNIRSQSSIFHSKTHDDAQQFNLGLEHKSTDGKFGLNVGINYNLDNNTIPNYPVNFTNYSLPPNYPLHNPDGSLYFGPGYTNPLAAFNVINNLKSSNLISNATMRYSILPDLDLKVSLGYNKMDVTGKIITPASANNPLYNYTPTASLNNNYIQTYIIEPQANYVHNWSKHRLSVLLGGTFQRTQTVQPYWVLGTFTNIQLASSISGLSILAKQAGFADYRYISGFTRVSYQFNDKYIFNINFRRDGSSRFGKNNRFGNFGSIGAAWVFSDENFMKDAVSWLSFGKLRASYGTIGNDKIFDYQYESLYMSLGSAYGSINAYGPGRIANPDLQWEVTKKADIALELGFFNSRVIFTADVYRNRSNNLLGTTTIAGQTGFDSYTANLPATVQNKGIELELNTINIQRKNFKWSSSFNLTIPQNKLVSFPNIASTYYTNQYVVGKSLSYNPLYHFTGFKDGIATVQDVDHDGQITYGLNDYGKGDLTGSANSDPKMYGGLSNTITYKGFELNLLIQGTMRDIFRGDLGLTTQPGMGYNIPASMLDIPVKYTATSGSASNNAWYYYTGSDAANTNASYLRLRNLSLAYNFTPAMISRLKMKTLQVYLRGQNLVTVTGYKGLDPETFDALPPMKVLLLGLRTTF